MGLVSNLLWAVGDLLLVALIGRALRLQLLTKYPYFYVYLFSVLCSDLFDLYLKIEGLDVQGILRWELEVITSLTGFGVTWEIYKQALLLYEGVRRMARTVLSIVLGVMLLNAAVRLGDNPARNFGPTTRELTRNLRVAQALLLVIVFSLILCYAIPAGRNLRSMLAGYSLLVASGVITLALSSRFAGIDWKWWSVPIQVEYCATLAVWLVGMWSYAPNPGVAVKLERDYERIAAQTSRAFGRLRDHLIQPWFE